MQMKFEVDRRMRHTVLQSSGKKFRTFKNMLTRKFIRPFKDEPSCLAHPPEKYSYIEQSSWDAFVQQRLSEEFQVI